MKEIRDYLHLYLGCRMMWRLIDDNEWKTGGIDLIVLNRIYDRQPFEVKPILRPLSSMTEDEMKELYFLVFNRKFVGDNITHRDIGKKNERFVLWSGVERLFIYADGNVGADSDLSNYRTHIPTILRWQLSKHFDLFGLIESGLAIDSTKQKTHLP